MSVIGKTRYKRSRVSAPSIGVIIDGVEHYLTATPNQINKLASEKIVKSKIVNVAHDTDEIGGDGAPILTLKAGEMLVSLDVRITEAWDATSGDKIFVGYGGSLDELVDNQDAQSLGLVTKVSGAVPMAVSDTDREIKVKVDPDVEDDASAGKAEILVTYTE